VNNKDHRNNSKGSRRVIGQDDVGERFLAKLTFDQPIQRENLSREFHTGPFACPICRCDEKQCGWCAKWHGKRGIVKCGYCQPPKKNGRRRPKIARAVAGLDKSIVQAIEEFDGIEELVIDHCWPLVPHMDAMGPHGVGAVHPNYAVRPDAQRGARIFLMHSMIALMETGVIRWYTNIEAEADERAGKRAGEPWRWQVYETAVVDTAAVERSAADKTIKPRSAGGGERLRF
jgi:hypothetical protein